MCTHLCGCVDEVIIGGEGGGAQAEGTEEPEPETSPGAIRDALVPLRASVASRAAADDAEAVAAEDGEPPEQERLLVGQDSR